MGVCGVRPYHFPSPHHSSRLTPHFPITSHLAPFLFLSFSTTIITSRFLFFYYLCHHFFLPSSYPYPHHFRTILSYSLPLFLPPSMFSQSLLPHHLFNHPPPYSPHHPEFHSPLSPTPLSSSIAHTSPFPHLTLPHLFPSFLLMSVYQSPNCQRYVNNVRGQGEGGRRGGGEPEGSGGGTEGVLWWRARGFGGRGKD